MVMRVGGLASGMDIESMVNKLMEAERMPLSRMEQDRTQLTWKRDAFRDVNRTLLELEKMILDMKLSKTYSSKTVISSQEGAVTARGSTSASNGSYHIKVSKLASSAMNVGTKEVELNDKINEDIDEIKFSTYDDQGVVKEHLIIIEDGDTIKDVLKKVKDGDHHVHAFYDSQSKKVVMETTRTGIFNTSESTSENHFNGAEIDFDESNAFFTTLGLDSANEMKAENAVITYNNGLTMETQSNSYELNGITLQFHNTTKENATLTVANDVEASFQSIMEFVDTYNNVIEKLNESQTEEIFRDFHPLTDEQKKEMSDDEIEKWEEKARSGILRGENSLSNGMYDLRRGWYANVNTGGEFTTLTQIGITTTQNYLDGGKLIVNEAELRQALSENPSDVQKIFSNSAKDESRGLVNRLEDSLKATIGNIEKQAGKKAYTLDNYTLGKRMKELNERMTAFEARIVNVETRYWNQFTQMEKAIQRMNDQSAQLLSQFGGNM